MDYLSHVKRHVLVHIAILTIIIVINSHHQSNIADELQPTQPSSFRLLTRTSGYLHVTLCCLLEAVYDMQCVHLQ